MAARRCNHPSAQGGKWCRPEKRYAIYLRDGLACAYCGATIEDDVMSLDHVLPYSQGSSNDASNLITACRRCNSARQDRPIDEFVESVAGYRLRDTPAQIIKRINRLLAQPIDRDAARELIQRRKAARS